MWEQIKHYKKGLINVYSINKVILVIISYKCIISMELIINLYIYWWVYVANKATYFSELEINKNK